MNVIDRTRARARVQRQLSDLEEAFELFRIKAPKQPIQIHTEEQLRIKKKAIRQVAEDFALLMRNGAFDNNDELLFFCIENLHSLVTEYKRG